MSHADDSRFLPGFLLAGRYRIVGLLGRGGMGEVYRADDLKLGQAVALKFLPREFAKDDERLARLLGEVKIARQVSHPNVCRVYDVVESEGDHFLSMEYVDGEDLASLLRRIGNLPKEKATQIARQLCAGLAAAHEQGILHRDLKPANVMIDGRGRAKITDFGLASLAEDLEATSAAVGTPVYMAPEQLAGQSASVKSDVYALGLVLYEMFTGRRPFTATTPAQLATQQQRERPSEPSSFIDGFDPAVERVLLRCLEREPRDRPSSPLAISAALPGGDALAAALAAGETPSPELVADAGQEGALRPAIATTLLVAILAGVVAIALLTPWLTIVPRLKLEKPPEVLAAEARELIRRLGYQGRVTDRASGLPWNLEFLDRFAKEDHSPDRWSRLASIQPAPLTFWYRESPQHLVTLGDVSNVSFGDPPNTIPGMRSVRLDARGNLLEFIAVPPRRDDEEPSPHEPDWTPLIEKSGLESSTLQPTRAVWNPPVTVDSRAAWDGRYPGQPDIPVHVEVGAYRGRPVYFDLVFPWTAADGTGAETAASGTGKYVVVTLALAILSGALLLARRNLRLGRGDRRGAFRFAAYMFVVDFVRSLIDTHHVASVPDEFGKILANVAYSLELAAIIWVVYIAIEPSVRRLWPTVLIGWSRLLSGRIRDPQIGRDILIGGVASVAFALSVALGKLVPSWLGFPGPMPNPYTTAALLGVRAVVAEFLAWITLAPEFPAILLLVILLLRIPLRRQWAAITAIVVILTAMSAGQHTSFTEVLVSLPFDLAFVGIPIFVLIRYGLLAAIFMFALNFIPIYPDMSAWYAGPSFLPVLVRLGLVAYGFHISRGRRGVFQESRLAA